MRRRGTLPIPWAAGILVGVLLAGALGYMLIEDWNFMDSLYMTIITVFTVGYGEVAPLSTAGRIFTSFLIVFGVASAFTLAASMAEELLYRERVVEEALRRRVHRLREHFIICGFGRTGEIVAETFRRRKVPFVVVEQEPRRIPRLVQLRYPFVEGDATDPEVLLKAGIRRARGVVTVLDTDAENLYVLLNVQEFNTDCPVVARVHSRAARIRLLRAGALKVANPYEQAGTYLAQAVLQPALVELFEILAGPETLDLSVEALRVPAESPLTGKTLAEADLGRKWNVIIVAIRKRGERLVFNPRGETRLEEGDLLFAMGHQEALQRLQESLLPVPSPEAL